MTFLDNANTESVVDPSTLKTICFSLDACMVMSLFVSSLSDFVFRLVLKHAFFNILLSKFCKVFSVLSQ